MPRPKDPSKLIAIHQAATRLLVKVGFTGLKMAQVAAEAGLATGTLYIYYKNKEALINGVFVATQIEIRDCLEAPELEKETFYETFEARWKAYFLFCFQQSDKMLFVEQFQYSGLLWEKSIQQADALFETYDLFLKKGQKQGFLRRMDLGILKAHLRGATHEIIKKMQQTDQECHEDAVDLYFDLAWNSVRK